MTALASKPRERPILFQGAMVRALLAGAKTQTRRGLRIQPFDALTVPSGNHLLDFRHSYSQGHGVAALTEHAKSSPYGAPGDRLWVREAWRAVFAVDGLPPRELNPSHSIWYEAQDEVPFHPTVFGKLRPSMFMPRWASRILLEITEVRIERLQDISRGDAVAEGCPFPNMAQGDDPRKWYAELWDLINGAGSWEANPWVWAVSFRPINPIPVPENTK